MLGINLDPADGFPFAFSIALQSHLDVAASAAGQFPPKLVKMHEDHAEYSSLARLLIVDRLVFLDAQAHP